MLAWLHREVIDWENRNLWGDARLYLLQEAKGSLEHKGSFLAQTIPSWYTSAELKPAKLRNSQDYLVILEISSFFRHSLIFFLYAHLHVNIF